MVLPRRNTAIGGILVYNVDNFHRLEFASIVGKTLLQLGLVLKKSIYSH